MNKLRQWFYFIIYSWWRLLFALGIYTRPTKPKTFIQENVDYIQPIKTRFLTTFDSQESFDENIDPLFFNKPDFTQYMTESNNAIEMSWRRRILIENTPRGNIIMYFDAYKLAFAFYCDQKVVSYDVLNAVAMKYVVQFRCRNFFLDEFILPKEYTSPLLKIHFSEDIKPTASSNQKNTDVKKPFAKLRDYSKEPPSYSKKMDNREQIQIQRQQSQQIEQKKNSFIYLGKTNNFNILQIFSQPKRVLTKITSPLLENIGIQREVLSYRQYKENKEKIQPCPEPEPESIEI